MRGRVVAYGVTALLAGTAACRSHKTKYVPQDVPDVLGVHVSNVQAAIVARVDSTPSPSWVTP